MRPLKSGPATGSFKPALQGMFIAFFNFKAVDEASGIRSIPGSLPIPKPIWAVAHSFKRPGELLKAFETRKMLGEFTLGLAAVF